MVDGRHVLMDQGHNVPLEANEVLPHAMTAVRPCAATAAHLKSHQEGAHVLMGALLVAGEHPRSVLTVRLSTPRAAAHVPVVDRFVLMLLFHHSVPTVVSQVVVDEEEAL